MTRSLLSILLILLSLVVQREAEAQVPQKAKIGSRKDVTLPRVPRISANEAYNKYNSGKALIIHAGGEAFEKRHIVGAIYVDSTAVVKGKAKIPNFPKKGIEIFTYCY